MRRLERFFSYLVAIGCTGILKENSTGVWKDFGRPLEQLKDAGNIENAKSQSLRSWAEKDYGLCGTLGRGFCAACAFLREHWRLTVEGRCGMVREYAECAVDLDAHGWHRVLLSLLLGVWAERGEPLSY
jgi:hypothetical protein